MSRFSVILPVRNGGNYIKVCVASILAQTYPEFNLVILENCSTDGTPEWLTTLTDPRISVIPAEKPLSIEDNWARILSEPATHLHLYGKAEARSGRKMGHVTRVWR